MESIFISGNIGSDADVKQKSQDQFLIRFSLAATKKWIDPETGEQDSRTNWYTVFKRTKNKIIKCPVYLKQKPKKVILSRL